MRRGLIDGISVGGDHSIVCEQVKSENPAEVNGGVLDRSADTDVSMSAEAQEGGFLSQNRGSISAYARVLGVYSAAGPPTGLSTIF